MGRSSFRRHEDQFQIRSLQEEKERVQVLMSRLMGAHAEWMRLRGRVKEVDGCLLERLGLQSWVTVRCDLMSILSRLLLLMEGVVLVVA